MVRVSDNLIAKGVSKCNDLGDIKDENRAITFETIGNRTWSNADQRLSSSSRALLRSWTYCLPLQSTTHLSMAATLNIPFRYWRYEVNEL
jgi:hypothetical protein